MAESNFWLHFRFCFAAFVVGFLCERGFDRKIESAILAMLIGNIIIYIPELLWLAKFVGLKKRMASISEANLVSAASNTGGLGGNWLGFNASFPLVSASWYS
jgi:biotin transporter BioY